MLRAVRAAAASEVIFRPGIAQRCGNAEIAARLMLSPKTVRNYVSSILSKLPVAHWAEAMAAARTPGLGQQSP